MEEAEGGNQKSENRRRYQKNPETNSVGIIGRKNTTVLSLIMMGFSGG